MRGNEREREREGGSSGGEFQVQVPVDEALPTTYQVPVDEAVVLEVVHGGTDLESHVQDDLVLLCQLLPIANELQQTTWTQHSGTCTHIVVVGVGHSTGVVDRAWDIPHDISSWIMKTGPCAVHTPYSFTRFSCWKFLIWKKLQPYHVKYVTDVHCTLLKQYHSKRSSKVDSL